tara:strand:- start:487 stop:738 length:252 start_codon:yes stop_codon:yes gene_type:complete
MNKKLEENIIEIGGMKVKESDLSPEQLHHKNHTLSLRNKIAKLQFEIDDLLPSLQFHENKLITITKEQADEKLGSERKIIGES